MSHTLATRRDVFGSVSSGWAAVCARWLGGHPAALGAVWLAGMVWLVCRADQGWIPHDAGTIAHAAQRVLEGELPHRDFDTPYTGGLEWLNALAFQLFGVRLVATRWMLLLAAAVFIPALYALAARVARPWLAAVATLTALAWSLPNYFTALPSWYNLFCATFGLLALLRHAETGRRRWLVAAGLAGGASCLFKLVGLYYLAAAGMFLLYREQSLSAEAPRCRRGAAHVVVVLAGLLGFVAALVSLVAYHPAFMELLHFGLPGLVLVALLARNELVLWRLGAPARTGALAGKLGWLALGVAAPIAVYLVPYLAGGNLADVWRGVVVLPSKRLDEAVVPLPAAWTLLGAVPLALALAAPAIVAAWPARGASGRMRGWPSRRTRGRRPVAAGSLGYGLPAEGAFAGLAAVNVVLVGALVAGGQEEVFCAVWGSARAAIPLAVLAGSWWLWRQGIASARGLHRQELFLMLAAAALVSLVQVPLAHAIYFLYAAPLAVLAVLYVIRRQWPQFRPLGLALAAFYLLFPLIWLHDAMPQFYGQRHVQLQQATPMEVERCGLRVDSIAAPMYRDLVAEVQRHAGDDPYIFAGPDCPEVYFLTGKRNPTRTFFAIFDADYGTPQRAERILRTLKRRGVHVVVLKHFIEVSPQGHDRLMARLAEAYPHSKAFNVVLPNQPPQTAFSVHWRDRTAAESNDLADRPSTIFHGIK